MTEVVALVAASSIIKWLQDLLHPYVTSTCGQVLSVTKRLRRAFPTTVSKKELDLRPSKITKPIPGAV